MPKDYFSVEGSSSLSLVPPGGRIHVVGVAGVAMAQISIELAHRGYSVSGTDVEFYEPMGSLLRSSSIKLHQGYSATHIPPDADLVLIGNSISYGNPEVAVIEEKGLPYTFFPKLLSEVIIRDGHSIVVSGTHGKTTTTGVCATVLVEAGVNPGYFVGGVVPGLAGGLHSGAGRFSVVEGDEYDSAFFAKVPKFNFYRPDTLIVTAIEFDHADIYPDLASIEREFSKLITSLPEKGRVVCCIDCPNVRRLLPVWKSEARASFFSYGFSAGADVQIASRSQRSDAQDVVLTGGTLSGATFSTPLSGEHNARNATAVYISCALNGIPPQKIRSGLAAFRGVRRRQEIRADGGGILLMEDFAHHPTAVLETIKGVRERYPERRIIAVFEPRSNTSRRKVFQRDYATAFSGANVVILSEVVTRQIDAGQDLMDVRELSDDIVQHGVPSQALAGAEAIRDELEKMMRSGDLILVMSNGSFGGLVQKLEEIILSRTK